MLPAILSSLADHLWQSTLFGIGAGLLALALKNNRARTRYWIWWAASIKFLVPFSLLIAVGGQVSWRPVSAVAVDPPATAVLVERVAQPFSSSPGAASTASLDSARPLTATPAANVLPVVIYSVWGVGSLLMLLRCGMKWRRVRSVARSGLRLVEGPEVEALQRLARTAGLRRPIGLVSTASTMEPSIFGMARPVLIWPRGLSTRLNAEELEAILLHEVSHVRRRDNLTAALHLVVEAVFWFHPLVWWIGNRLVDEREKACDEDVLAWGGAATTYAEGILKVCEFCLQSSFVAAAGITGSDLKQRIEKIVRNREALRLSFSRVLLLVLAALVALASPVAIGMVNAPAGLNRLRPAAFQPAPVEAAPAVTAAPTPTDAIANTTLAAADEAAAIPAAAEPVAKPAPPPAFESYSVRPSAPVPAGARRGGGRGRGGSVPPWNPCTGSPAQVDAGNFTATNKTLYSLITMAYGINCANSTIADTLSGGPVWVRTDQFDIDALMPTPAGPEPPTFQPMLQAMLRDYFKLALHREERQMSAYLLTVDDDGAKLQPSTSPERRNFLSVSRVLSTKTSLTDFAALLTTVLGRPVIVRPPVAGEFDIDVTFAPAPAPNGPVVAFDREALLSALREHLGIALQEAGAPVEVLVIDAAEKPSDQQ